MLETSAEVIIKSELANTIEAALPPVIGLLERISLHFASASANCDMFCECKKAGMQKKKCPCKGGRSDEIKYEPFSILSKKSKAALISSALFSLF